MARDWMGQDTEAAGVHHALGLARNKRLEALLQPTFETLHASHAAACEAARSEGREAPHAARAFGEFTYQTKDSWSRARRVIGKAEILGEKQNPRFIVTGLTGEEQWAKDLPEMTDGRALYEKFYCARGDMENRIKEQQLDLFADRTVRMASAFPLQGVFRQACERLRTGMRNSSDCSLLKVQSIATTCQAVTDRHGYIRP